jgi:hypothetical protein
MMVAMGKKKHYGGGSVRKRGGGGGEGAYLGVGAQARLQLS